MRDLLLNPPLSGAEPAGRDVFITSSARYLRNLEGEPFPRKSSRDEAAAVRSRILEALPASGGAAPETLVMEDAPGAEIAAMVERGWVEASEVDDAGAAFSRAVAVWPDGAESCFVNGAEHLRLRASLPGLACAESLALIREREKALDGLLRFAASFDYGYLVSRPEDAGAALRLTAWAFLPGIMKAGVFDRVARDLLASGIEPRYYGREEPITGEPPSEGEESACPPEDPFVELSARVPLGSDEAVFAERFEASLRSLAEGELRTRERVLERERSRIEDAGYRAAALLRAARLLSAEETARHLAALRCSLVTGTAPRAEDGRDQIAAVDALLLLAMPAHTRLRTGEKGAGAAEECRAELVRGTLPRYLI